MCKACCRGRQEGRGERAPGAVGVGLHGGGGGRGERLAPASLHGPLSHLLTKGLQPSSTLSRGFFFI